MLGQAKLLNKIDRLKDRLPRFIILVGEKGSGRGLVINEIAARIKAEVVENGIKADEIREAIELARTNKIKTLYILKEAEKMSITAKNVLLKITEEPPKSAYFLITATTTGHLPTTLISRALVLCMDAYTQQELLEYIGLKNYRLNIQEEKLVLDICTTPSQITDFMSYNLTEFYNFVVNVVKNIAVVNEANALKIVNRLKCKGSDTVGYEINLFLRALLLEYKKEYLRTKDRRYLEYMKVTLKYIRELQLNSISKSSTIDMYIIELRGIENVV